MNRQKLEMLFKAARNEAAPAPSTDFAMDVLRAVRREKQIPPTVAFSIYDQLNLLFPKLAWTAVAVIVFGIATDFGLTVAGVPGLGDGVSQISSQWLFTGSAF